MAEPTKAPKAPRSLDPEIKQLREQHKPAVADMKRRRASNALLKTILEKRLPSLIDQDKEKLFDYLAGIITPSLPAMPPRPPLPAIRISVFRLKKGVVAWVDDVVFEELNKLRKCGLNARLKSVYAKKLKTM
jgi:hypothetical protein